MAAFGHEGERMRLVLATGNKGKVKEIRDLMPGFTVVPYSDLIAPFEIVEDGDTFQKNALIKARAVFNALGDDDALVISDDSGISVPALGGAPGIYSARYAGKGASDQDNVRKLCNELKKSGLKETPAFYTAAVAVVGRAGEHTVHGWMHGRAIDAPRGSGGFGYDPVFIPEGFAQTAAELPDETKGAISHRGRSLALLRSLLSVIAR